jgi:hypothetical protein
MQLVVRAVASAVSPRPRAAGCAAPPACSATLDLVDGAHEVGAAAAAGSGSRAGLLTSATNSATVGDRPAARRPAAPRSREHVGERAVPRRGCSAAGSRRTGDRTPRGGSRGEARVHTAAAPRRRRRARACSMRRLARVSAPRSGSAPVRAGRPRRAQLELVERDHLVAGADFARVDACPLRKSWCASARFSYRAGGSGRRSPGDTRPGSWRCCATVLQRARQLVDEDLLAPASRRST